MGKTGGRTQAVRKAEDLGKSHAFGGQPVTGDLAGRACRSVEGGREGVNECVMRNGSRVPAALLGKLGVRRGEVGRRTEQRV